MASRIGESLEVKFWRHTVKADGCWLWRSAIVANGYGGVKHNGKMVRAHRASWLIHYGPIPDGLQVCHRCDVKPCVNPEHLFVGTHKDNMRDCVEKGRRPPINYDWRGKKRTEEAKRKTTQSLLEYYSEYPMSDESKHKKSEAMKRYYSDPAARAANSARQTGRIMSEETKAKISKAQLGNKYAMKGPR